MRTARLILSGVAVGLCLIALPAFENLRAEKKTRTVTGIVQAAEIYRGKVRGVYIANRTEGDFLVVRGGEKGIELVEHVGETVTATGYVRKSARDPEFPYLIDVVSYEIDLQKESAPRQ